MKIFHPLHSLRTQTLLFFLFLPFIIHADINTSSISSEKASYDGNALVLEGSVNLQHALGKLQAGNARLLRATEGSPFTAIHLRDDVLITLENRGKIFCARADFDFDKLTGTLIPKLGETIRFVNLQTGPLSLESKQATIEFARDASSIKVAKIEARDSVQMHYGKDFFLTAESATYSNTTVPYVWASQHCTLTHFDDHIEADRIEVLPDTAKMILTSPTGRLTPALSPSDGIQFSCKKLIWEKAPQILTLKGDIYISDTEVGDIHCEDEVELRQKQQDGKWILNSITAKGKTELNYKLDVDFQHLLICYGQMHLDQDRLVLNLESPPEEPLEYFHDKMKLCAKHAELQYAKDGNSITPKKLFLCGNIQLSSLEDASRCAVADQFTYFPEEKKIVLSAKDGGSVLFWDQQQELSISAREVHIRHTEKGEHIKGVGNVSFAFSNVENALLKKLFPFYQPNGRRQL
ncbi:MAG: hypothetical protein KR126chlam3_00628 [Chlamydiae bacterium]|nr:hypothetical protein [Chlamydiota bacterium]